LVVTPPDAELLLDIAEDCAGVLVLFEALSLLLPQAAREKAVAAARLTPTIRPKLFTEITPIQARFRPDTGGNPNGSPILLSGGIRSGYRLGLPFFRVNPFLA